MSEPSLAMKFMKLDDSEAQELVHAMEAQNKAKANVRRHFRTYKGVAKASQGDQESRQPYMPVVAVPPEKFRLVQREWPLCSRRFAMVARPGDSPEAAAEAAI